MALEHSGIEHVGFVTEDVKLFEAFWCDVLGYVKVKENELPRGLGQSIFGIGGKITVRRYEHPQKIGPDIETHLFGRVESHLGRFNRMGLNHICLHVKDKAAFLHDLPQGIEQHCYYGPHWIYAFIRDFEGNWIELREPQH